MRLTLERIGPIKTGSVALAGLTILAGGNNTGKTFFTYSLFGLISELSGRFNFGLEIHKLAAELEKGSTASILYTPQNLMAAFQTNVGRFSPEDIARIFSAEDDFVKDAAFSFEFLEPKVKSSHRLTSSFILRGETFKLEVRGIPEEQVWAITVARVKEKSVASQKIFVTSFVREVSLLLRPVLLPVILPRAVISTSERLGIALFYKDLDSSRNALVEQLQHMAASGSNRWSLDPWELIEKATSRFALPIHTNINFVRELDSVQKQQSSIDVNLSDYIWQMMDGGYRVEDDQIIFSNNRRGQNRIKLPIHLGSSSIRSLADIFFYLKHVAASGDLLMIDEPESHLTPQNQMVLARMVAATVNAGVKVLLTTHSDYLIRELNNLITLSSVAKEDFQSLQKQFGFKTNEVLRRQDVRGYICGNGEIVECECSAFGLNFSNLDDAITSLNDRSHAIYSAALDAGADLVG